MTNQEGSEKLPVKLRRNLLPSDEGFIYNSWLKSHRSSAEVKRMDNDVYYDNHKQIIANILERPETSVLLIVNETDEDHIYGYGVFEQLGDAVICHYIYVKYNYRKFGLGNMVFNAGTNEEVTACTHQNYLWDQLSKKYDIFFNPHLR